MLRQCPPPLLALDATNERIIVVLVEQAINDEIDEGNKIRIDCTMPNGLLVARGRRARVGESC